MEEQKEIFLLHPHTPRGLGHIENLYAFFFFTLLFFLVSFDVSAVLTLPRGTANLPGPH